MKKSYVFLIVVNALQIMLGVLSLVGFIGYQSEGGAPRLDGTREDVQAWLDKTEDKRNLKIAILGYDTQKRDMVYTIRCLEVWDVVLGLSSLGTGILIFVTTSRYRKALSTIAPQILQTAPTT